MSNQTVQWFRLESWAAFPGFEPPARGQVVVRIGEDFFFHDDLEPSRPPPSFSQLPRSSSPCDSQEMRTIHAPWSLSC